MKTRVHIKTGTWMFIAAPFIITKTSSNRQVNKKWQCIHTRDKKEWITYITTWMNLKSPMLSERRPWGYILLWFHVFDIGKTIVIEDRSVVVRFWGAGRIWLQRGYAGVYLLVMNFCIIVIMIVVVVIRTHTYVKNHGTVPLPESFLLYNNVKAKNSGPTPYR